MRKNLHLTTFRVMLLYVTVAIALITAGGTISARAGDDPGDLINYSFAVWLGSGVYKVNSADKRLAVLRAPFAYTLRDAQYDKAAFRDKLGLRIQYGISFLNTCILQPNSYHKQLNTLCSNANAMLTRIW